MQEIKQQASGGFEKWQEDARRHDAQQRPGEQTQGNRHERRKAAVEARRRAKAAAR